MAVLLVGIYSEGSVWLVREVRRVLRLLGVGSKTKNWVDCNRNDDETFGGDGRGVVSLIGGMFHGRGMRSREEGPMYFFTGDLTGGNGISSGVSDLFQGVGMIGVAVLCSGDGVSD